MKLASLQGLSAGLPVPIWEGKPVMLCRHYWVKLVQLQCGIQLALLTVQDGGVKSQGFLNLGFAAVGFFFLNTGLL